MDKEKTLNFLRAHQPMPDTNENDCEELIAEWERVCEYFTEHPCIEALPLFFGTFGGGDGYGVYQRLSDFISELDPEEAAPYFIEALNSGSDAIREQVSEFAMDCESSDPEYIETLWKKVEDVNENSDVRVWCASALEYLASADVYDVTPYVDRIKEILEKLGEDKFNKRTSQYGIRENLEELLSNIS